MFLVIMAMLVTSMFVAAAFAAANGDLPMSGDSKDRKATYAAAEAGLNFYLNHLQQDNDYWTHCDQRCRPRTRPSSTRSTSSGTAPARTRAAGARSPARPPQYTIELLHTPSPVHGLRSTNQQDR